ncbi:hypothetical protein LINPERHAP1_LOCUS12340, partial [Linum perenne]
TAYGKGPKPTNLLAAGAAGDQKPSSLGRAPRRLDPRRRGYVATSRWKTPRRHATCDTVHPTNRVILTISLRL